VRKEKKREIREDGNTFWSEHEIRGGGGGGGRKKKCHVECYVYVKHSYVYINSNSAGVFPPRLPPASRASL